MTPADEPERLGRNPDSTARHRLPPRDRLHPYVDHPRAAACVEILNDPAAARQRALRGKEYVRRNFLMPRLLRDWLVLLNKLDGNDTEGAEVTEAAVA